MSVAVQFCSRVRRAVVDAVDNLLDLTHGGDQTSWKYDDVSHVIEETDPITNVTIPNYFRDDGRLGRTYDRNERLIDYFYDKLGRVTAEFWYDDIRTIEYFFDELGRLDQIEDLDANAPDYDFDYDRLDRLKQTTWTSGANTYSQVNGYDVGRRNNFALKVNAASTSQTPTTTTTSPASST
jgi:YD repeat-containing protein